MDKIEFIIGDQQRLENIVNLPAWKPFDQRIVHFFNELSRAILKAPQAKMHPDIISLAFWLRKGNLQAIQKHYADCGNRLGCGLTFHIAPGNVALSFAYSMLTGLLTGNTNIIRLPSRRFEQAELFCKVLSSSLERHIAISERICLIKYPHDKTITDELSKICHTRIIWGGDQTIATIRQSPLPPRANEITFANRFSICLINSDKYLSEYDAEKIAQDFYVDTYLSDQNACSSPRIIFWHGEKIDEAKEVFWNALYERLSEYYVAPVTTVDKLTTFCKFAAENDCKIIHEPDFKITRICLQHLDQSVLNCIGNSGYFYEYSVSNIDEILPVCTWELQTLSYIGFEGSTLRNFILSSAPNGIDRIVQVGRTMDFGLVWDGVDIVRQLSRAITVT